jgi:hypothetical protein
MNETRKIVTRLLLAVVISLVFGSATRLFDPLVFHTSSAQSNSTENPPSLPEQSNNTTTPSGSMENNATTTGALPPPPVTGIEAPTDRRDVCIEDRRAPDCDNHYRDCLRATTAENCR